MYKVILILITLALCIWATNQAIKAHEEMECVQWEEDSSKYPNWYSTNWQKAQCEIYGINLK